MSILRSLNYPNRIVALLTPVLVPLAGFLATVVADWVPGIPKDQLTEIFIAGSVIALAPALHFLHGRLKWDPQQDQKESLAAAAAPGTAPSAADFAAIGIEAPTLGMPVPATEAAPAEFEQEFADEEEEEEDESADLLDEVGDLMDAEEFDELPEPLQTTER